MSFNVQTDKQNIFKTKEKATALYLDYCQVFDMEYKSYESVYGSVCKKLHIEVETIRANNVKVRDMIMELLKNWF